MTEYVERIDLPGVVEVGDHWYAVTDAGRTLHVVLGAVEVGVSAVCGQRVVREAVPLDGNRLCRRCDRLTTDTGSSPSAVDRG